jgi:hypothetical protein
MEKCSGKDEGSEHQNTKHESEKRRQSSIQVHDEETEIFHGSKYNRNGTTM